MIIRKETEPKQIEERYQASSTRCSQDRQTASTEAWEPVCSSPRPAGQGGRERLAIQLTTETVFASLRFHNRNPPRRTRPRRDQHTEDPSAGWGRHRWGEPAARPENHRQPAGCAPPPTPSSSQPGPGGAHTATGGPGKASSRGAQPHAATGTDTRNRRHLSVTILPACRCLHETGQGSRLSRLR